jgi:hypothetical protein
VEHREERFWNRNEEAVLITELDEDIRSHLQIFWRIRRDGSVVRVQEQSDCDPHHLTQPRVLGLERSFHPIDVRIEVMR